MFRGHSHFRALSGRWRALAGCAAMAVALTCAGCGATHAPPAAGRGQGGPLLTLVTTSAVTATGLPKEVTQEFPANHSSALALAVLGHLGSDHNLVMTWSRLSPNPAVLFTKQVAVASFGTAYTTAATKGTLPFGVYRVSASIGGVTKSVEWTVYTPAKTTIANFHHQGPLTAGPSRAFAAAIPPGHQCEGVTSVVSMPTSTEAQIAISAYCPPSAGGGPTRGAELASMSHDNGLALVGSMHLRPDGFLAGNYTVNVCKLPHASNAPGAVIYLTTIVYFHGGTRAFTGYFTLPPDHIAPELTLKSSVPAGSVVHPGEQIKFELIGTEPNAFGPQVGIRFLRLSGPLGGRIRAITFPKDGCGLSRLRRTLTYIYRVPKHSAKVITLTGVASDVPGRNATRTISFTVSG